MRRPALFALTGILWLVTWAAGPSFVMLPSLAKWLVVLSFSAALLSLAVALPVFGRIVGGSWVVRWATIAGALAGLCCVANVFEDGFQMDWVFLVFAVGLTILDVALLALTIVIARTAPNRYRLLAVVPAGTLAGILVFPVAGGAIMLVTWLTAAVAALKMPSPQTPVPTAAEPTSA